jgi:hypothetical protein
MFVLQMCLDLVLCVCAVDSTLDPGYRDEGI